jgi:predicted ATPase
MSLEAKPYLKSVSLLHDKIEDREQFPFCLPVIRNFERLDFHSDVTFLVGENGSGKSTLIEALAVLMKLNAEGGSKDFAFSSRATHSQLHNYLRPSKGFKLPGDSFFLRAESFYNVASYADDVTNLQRYGGTSLHQQSHGESFWSLISNRFSGHGLYIMDEPEAALSPTRQIALLRLMHNLVQDESQFIIATHSPILLSYPSALIYEIREGYLCTVAYEETEHYQVTKTFLANYRRQLAILFEE